MDIFLDPESGQSLTGQLYEQLRRAITGGRLLPGDQLVPSRQLADELGVSRHTVTTVYGRLVAEGYAEGRAGGGSVVASASPAPPKGAGAAAALRPSPRFAGWSPYFRPPPYGCRLDLRPGLSDPALFPAAMWRRRVAAAVAAEHREYGDPAGRIRLRRAIAGWVARSRSVAGRRRHGRRHLRRPACHRPGRPGLARARRLRRDRGPRVCAGGAPVRRSRREGRWRARR